MQLIIPKHSWVLKKELFDMPVFGWGLRMLNPVAIDRSNSRSVLQILTEGQKNRPRFASDNVPRRRYG